MIAVETFQFLIFSILDTGYKLMFVFKMVPYDFRIALNCPTLEKIV